MEENKPLTAKKAAKYLGLSYYAFLQAVNNGKIGFVIASKRKIFYIGELNKWQKNTQYHTDYTKDRTDRVGMHTSHFQAKTETGKQLESLQGCWKKMQQHNSV